MQVLVLMVRGRGLPVRGSEKMTYITMMMIGMGVDKWNQRIMCYLNAPDMEKTKKDREGLIQYNVGSSDTCIFTQWLPAKGRLVN